MRCTPGALGRIVFLLVLLIAIGGLADPALASVTSIKAEHRQGQTFLTFTESSPVATYQVYRSASPITSLSGMKPIARLDSDSGTYRYTGKGLVICDLCSPLSNDTGLLVWTTAENGVFYYAVQVTGESSFAVAGPVAETRQDVPGVVLVEDWSQPSGPATNRYRKYFAWEDYSKWGHGSWGYYGNKFVVTQSVAAYPIRADQTYPLTLILHGAGQVGYMEAVGVGGIETARGFYVSPVDMNWSGSVGPYGERFTHSWWTGYPTPDDDRVQRNATAIRVVRYVKTIASDANYRIDPSRLYISGASMGGTGIHIAYDAANAGVFAAVQLISGVPTFQMFSGCRGLYGPNADRPFWKPFDLRLDTSKQLAWAEWGNVNVSVKQRRSLPPALYGWGTDDTNPTCMFAQAIPATEAARQAVFAKWVLNGGHGNTQVTVASETTALYLRFKSNESYPAFSSVSKNDDITNMTSSGQHNLTIDWQSALHSFPGGQAITDTPSEFGISLKALTGDATVELTIRNAQEFKPSPGQPVSWRAEGAGEPQSGSVIADGEGLVTLRLRVSTSASRLTLACAACRPDR